ncbi:MAG: hypothetical protein KC983_01310 [Phycisphaerales bacterium]|nr:hypothetical protein [Phycisphaerales bacterium]
MTTFLMLMQSVIVAMNAFLAAPAVMQTDAVTVAQETTPAPATAPEQDAGPPVAPDVEPAPPANLPVDINVLPEHPMHPDPEIDAMLDAIEASTDGLTGFTAMLRYEDYDAILRRKKIRIGTMIYEHTTPERPRRFAILLDKILRDIGGGKYRVEERPQHFIFDGRRLAEINHDAKQYIERELVPPGEEFDALKIGNGPFPLPVGQEKADVLSRYEVAAVAVPDSGELANIRDIDKVAMRGLRLTPKPHLPESDDLACIDLYFDTTTWLPVGVIVTEKNRNVKTVSLRKIDRNPAMSAEQRAKLELIRPDPTIWQIDIRRWE